MNGKLKLLGALMVAGAFSTGALAQTAATPAASGDASSQQTTGTSDSTTKAEKKAHKKQQKQAKRDRNQNNVSGPAETSAKPQPAAGTGSQ